MQVLSAAGQHQVLIFVHSRKETAKTARYLKETALANDTLMRFMKVVPVAHLSAGTSIGRLAPTFTATAQPNLSLCTTTHTLSHLHALQSSFC